jgi:Fe-S-cluster containining protein
MQKHQRAEDIQRLYQSYKGIGANSGFCMDSCLSCDGNCCRSYTVPLTHFDLSRIISYGIPQHMSVDWLPVGSMFSTYPDVRLDDGYHYMVLKKVAGGACTFSVCDKESLRCGIHGNHPLLCRIYPYDLDGNLVSKMCKAVKPFRPLNDLLPQGRLELSDYSDKVSVWNRNRRKSRRPLDFITYLLDDAAQ